MVGTAGQEQARYLAAVNADLERLYQEETPATRLRGIYRTSRHNISRADAEQLWPCLLPLRRILQRQDAPMSQDEYDDLVLLCAMGLQRRLYKLGDFWSFGIGQKVVNLFMKDQWALGRVDEFEGLLHAPLDRIVLSHVQRRREIAPAWRAWTKVRSRFRSSPAATQYIDLQRFIQGEAAVLRISAIRLEQRWWEEGVRSGLKLAREARPE